LRSGDPIKQNVKKISSGENYQVFLMNDGTVRKRVEIGMGAVTDNELKQFGNKVADIHSGNGYLFVVTRDLLI